MDRVCILATFLGTVLPPEQLPGDERRVDAGRRIFRRSGCSECHLEARVAGGAVVPLGTLVAGYHQSDAAVVPENPDMGYDDRIALTPGEDSIARRGYKVPSLLGLRWSAPYLHDGSVPTLEALFSPERGPGAPHPYVIASLQEREELVEFLRAWDGRKYP